MKNDRTIYWVTTVTISLVMLFSIYKMFSPDYDRLGFPHYFRIELTIAKMLGLAALLIPQIKLRIKEWAYAGFGIILISAAWAHFYVGDGAASLEPLIFLVILAVSNRYLHKLKTSAV